jgi:hypothetical protein
MLHRKNFIIGSALALVTSATLSSTAQAQSVFSDVPDNHWAAAAVKRLAEAGIIEGRPGAGRSSETQASVVQKVQTVAKTGTTKPEKVASTANNKAPGQRVVAAAKASKNSSANRPSGNSR